MLTRRHSEILRILDDEGPVAVSDLALRLGVSAETVRRDIRPLTDTGRVTKMHGAVGLAGELGEAPFQRRMRENSAAKQAIARTVAASIRNGDSLLLDTGTTTSFLARALLGHRRLTVVTNSSDVARTLAPVNGNRVFMAGGEIRADSGAALGATAIDFISRFAVTHAIISAGAVDAETGVMDFDLDEAEFARLALTCGQNRRVITDHTKFGRRGLVTVVPLAGISELVTDRAPGPAIAAAVTAAGATLTIAG